MTNHLRWFAAALLPALFVASCGGSSASNAGFQNANGTGGSDGANAGAGGSSNIGGSSGKSGGGGANGGSSSTGGSATAGTHAAGGHVAGSTSAGGNGGAPTGGSSDAGGAGTSGGAGSNDTAGAGGSPTAGSGGSDTSAGGMSSGGAAGVPDPAMDGPYAITEIDDKTTVASTNDAVPIHCAYPTSGPTAGPYPVIVIAHGFQLPASQYYGYAKRLATFGYVALTADFPASLVAVNNVQNAKDLVGGLDWAFASPKLSGIADPNAKAGITGHSLGGKDAIIAASMDSRFGATITLDPVNSSMSCSATNCPDATTLLPLGIPTSFLGETTDSAGGFMPCAPAADNYETFYAKTATPSFAVTVLGANHMSFLDSPSTCGIVCSFCQKATADHTAVINMAYAYVAAFYERNLRGNTAYDDYLTGPTANARYVATGLVTIETK